VTLLSPNAYNFTGLLNQSGTIMKTIVIAVILAIAAGPAFALRGKFERQPVQNGYCCKFV
jgi:hypothetical protein